MNNKRSNSTVIDSEGQHILMLYIINFEMAEIKLAQ
jgi:hypothetical protein